MLKALHGESMLSLTQLEKQVQYEKQHIKYQISLLQDDGYVVEEKKGHYRITAPGEKELRRCRISSTIGFDTEPQ